MAYSPYARGAYAAAQSATAALAHARWPLGAAGRLGDGGGANARRDYPRGGASVCALDRRGPERRANKALDELGLWEQRRRLNAAVGCNGGRAHYNRVSTSPCPESRAGGCEAEDLTGHGPRVC